MSADVTGSGGKLTEYQREFDALARSLGLDYYPVLFEQVPASFMMEIAVYGLPVRMPHWSFGVRYIYQLVQHRMGNSRVFEVVFPGNPGKAYLAKNNTLPENTLVSAHVLGHADFSKNNALFARSQDEVGYRIVDQAAEHARRIGAAAEAHGQERVEAMLDAALALEQHIDTHRGLRRQLFPQYEKEPASLARGEFRKRFDALPGDTPEVAKSSVRRRAAIPPQPERDLLWFVAHYAPELEDWERDICLTVREESFYFYPVFACQIMNEGWASYWHARLLREAEFLPQDEYLEAIKTHSDVVRPIAGDQQVALNINPYHLGFVMWEKIIEEQGLEAARQIMREDDDFGFIRNHLTEELAHELDLFVFQARSNGEIKVQEFDVDLLRESILGAKFNFGAPAIFVVEMAVDGSLTLGHDHATDKRGLDLDRAEKVLRYLHRIWRRPIKINTVDAAGKEKVLSVS